MSISCRSAGTLLLTGMTAIIVASVAHAQRPASIQGVWKIVETQAPGAAVNTKPQPSVFLFTKKYYSFSGVTTAETRQKNSPTLRGQQLADAEKIALYEEWRGYASDAGTYEIQGNTLKTRPIVAKNQGVMVGADNVYDVTTDGKTMTLVSKSDSGYGQIGMRTRLTRVE